MVRLNEVIERIDEDMRNFFYRTSVQAQIDSVLFKLQTLLKPVRAMKEVEEFQAVREEASY
jgi:hypothetical protein